MKSKVRGVVEWERLFEEQVLSGETIKDFCSRKKIPVQTYYSAKQELSKRRKDRTAQHPSMQDGRRAAGYKDRWLGHCSRK